MEEKKTLMDLSLFIIFAQQLKKKIVKSSSILILVFFFYDFPARDERSINVVPLRGAVLYDNRGGGRSSKDFKRPPKTQVVGTVMATRVRSARGSSERAGATTGQTWREKKPYGTLLYMQTARAFKQWIKTIAKKPSQQLRDRLRRQRERGLHHVTCIDRCHIEREGGIRERKQI